MYIKSLSLHGYKYFKFAHIESLTITPKNKIQLIVGASGSSKSSLMRAYSPTPMQSTQFSKTGAKEEVIEHHGHVYTLGYDGVQKLHSFKQDGVELNTSGTSVVQEELVNTHFNYSKLVEKLIFNKVRMSQMTPSARMELLTSLNPINIKFMKDKYVKILSQYKKLKAQKELIQKRASDYRSAQMEDVQYNEYLKDRDTIKTLDDGVLKCIHKYETLIEQLPNITPIKNIQEYKDLLKRITKFRSRNKSYTIVESLSTLEVQYTSISHQLQQLNLQLTEIAKEIDDLELLAKKTTVTDFTALEKQYQEYTTLLQSYPDFSSKFIIDWPPVNDQDIAYEHLHRLNNLVNALSDVYRRPIWRMRKYEIQKHRYLHIVKKRDDLAYQLRLATEKLSQLEKDRDVLVHQSPDTTCTSTTCIFKLRHDGLCQKSQCDINTCHQQVEFLNKQYQKFIAIVVQYSAIMEYQNKFHGNNGIIAEILETINQISVELLRLFPKQQDSIIELLNQDLSLVTRTVTDVLHQSSDYKEYIGIKTKIQEISAILATKQKDITLSYIKKRLSDRKKAFSITEAKLEVLQKKLDKISSTITYYKKMDYLRNDLKRIVEDITHDTSALRTQTQNQLYHSTLDQLNALHAHLSNILRDMNDVIHTQKRIRDLEKIENTTLESLDSMYTDIDIVTQALDPYKGLPAMYTTHHINKILTNINYFISQVFSYPLSISLVEDTKDMKYRFQVQVDDIAVGDISQCSDGQMEIIDLAFTLAIMIALGIHNTHPLFLDEVGRCLDATHLQRLLELLHSLVEQGYISQLFIINHQAIMIGGFTSDTADIVCLKSDNVVLPEVYNEIVEIDQSF